ncbi:MAG: hypothetical protein JO285_07910 [Kutzneria sp.]|nr:hypothetical protein [Kutzneria sp.]
MVANAVDQYDPAAPPIMILTASMGSGHTRAAEELARRLSGWTTVLVVDLLDVLPWRLGTALRDGYALMLRRAPWLHEGIFQVFFVSRTA